MILNFDNVEKIIFSDKNVQKLLPEYKNIFGQWILGKQVSSLAFVSQKSLAILLESLTPEQVKILEEYFQENIFIETIQHTSVSNFVFKLDGGLSDIEPLGNNFCISRDEKNLYMTFYR